MKSWNQLTVPTSHSGSDLSIRNVGIEVGIYSSLAFIIPFLIGSPQLLVGAAVNTVLVLAALNLRQSQWLPVAILPSIGVLARGILWGPFITYLVYLLPIIWLANILFISIIQFSLNRSQYSYWTTLILSALSKTMFLGIMTLALFAFDIVPKAILLFMSVYQLVTALTGGLIATGIQSYRR